MSTTVAECAAAVASVGETRGAKSVGRAEPIEAGSDAAFEVEVRQIAELLGARRYVYLLFHKVFGGEPTEELLGILGSDNARRAIAPYAEEDEVMNEYYEFLPSVAAKAGDASFVSEVAGEYTRRLIGPDPLAALPWESPYRSHQRTLFQGNTVAVRRVYEAAGLAPKKMRRVPDDHVALMCDFMAYRAASLQDAFESALRSGESEAFLALLVEQGRFVHNHLNDWLDDFAHQSCLVNPLRPATQDLYPQCAKGLASFAQLDEVFLQQVALWLDAAKESMESCADAEHVAIVESIAVSSSEACRSLRAVRLFGLEDNELEPLRA